MIMILVVFDKFEAQSASVFSCQRQLTLARSTLERVCAPGFSMKRLSARQAGESQNGLRSKIQASRFPGWLLTSGFPPVWQ
jgi:hypothetical protein